MKTGYNIIISYAKADTAEAEMLKKLLQEDKTAQIYDAGSMPASWQPLGTQDGNKAIFLSLWSKAYQRSGLFTKQLKTAMSRQKEGIPLSILFFLIEDIRLPNQSGSGHWVFSPFGSDWRLRFPFVLRALYQSDSAVAEWVRCENNTVTLKKLNRLADTAWIQPLLEAGYKELTLLKTDLDERMHIESFPSLEKLTFKQCGGMEQNWENFKMPQVRSIGIVNSKQLNSSFAALLEKNKILELTLSRVDAVESDFWTRLDSWLDQAESLSVEGLNLDRTFFRILCGRQRPQMAGLSLQYIEIPGDLSELLDMRFFPALRRLRLQGVNMQLLPKDFYCLKKLTDLELSNVPLRELTSLDVGSSLPHDPGDYFLIDCPEQNQPVFQNLKRLVLFNTQLKELPSFHETLHLEELRIQGTDIKTLPPCYISQKLKILYLSGTRMKELPCMESPQECLHLEELHIPMSSIKTLPPAYLTEELRVLDLSYSGVSKLDARAFGGAKSLEKLNVSHTSFRTLPQRSPNCAKNLRELCLRGSNLTCVPDWVGHCNRLEYLDLQQLSLEQLPTLFGGMEHYVTEENWSAESAGRRWHCDGALCRILIAGLHIGSMDPRILSSKYRVLLKRYLTEKDHQKLYRGNIVLIGDEDTAAVAEWLTDTPLREWRNGYGFRVTDSSNAFAALFEHAGAVTGKSPSRSLQGRFMLMDSHPAAHLIHPCFMTGHSLYLIVLNGDHWERVPQSALYWARMVESYTSHSHIIFVIRYSGGNTVNIPLLKQDIWLDKEAKIVHLDTSAERKGVRTDERQSLCRLILNYIQELTLYSFSMPSGWLQALRHLEGLLAVRNFLSQSEFRKILDSYLSEYAYYRDEKFQRALEDYLLEFEEKTIGRLTIGRDHKDGETFYLYNAEWLAESLYRLAQYAQEHKGEVDGKDFWESLIDHAEREYSLNQVKYIIRLCSDWDLCYQEGKNGTMFLFPCFASALIGKNQIADPGQMQPDTDSERYTIRCPLLSRQILDQFEVHMRRSAVAEFYAVQEGVFFLSKRGTKNMRLLVQGCVGAGQDLRLWFSKNTGGRGGASSKEELIKTALREWTACISQLPEYIRNQFEITVERYLGDPADFRFQEKEEISLKNMMGYQRAGRVEYFSGTLNRNYTLADFTLLLSE